MEFVWAKANGNLELVNACHVILLVIVELVWQTEQIVHGHQR
jgi:hypothetical protein